MTEPSALVPRPRILLVDDEPRLTGLLSQALTRAGYDVVVAGDGPTGLARARAGGHDAVILDVMLPGLSGYRVLQQLRREGIDVPVVMLTAKDGEYDEADALDLGADDYVTKPFSSLVLTARLAALLRRSVGGPAVQRVGTLRVDPVKRRVLLAGREVAMTRREFDLTAHLVAHRDEVVPKASLLEQVWQEPYADPNLVEVCVLQVRRKLGPGWIETVRHVGYRLVDPEA